jgi:predicted TIM-barrel fold metal-dependent hydrolase
MAGIDFQAFDSDHHYYEAEDAFTRHVDRKMWGRCMQWAVINGRKRLIVAGKLNRFIPNPTFDPVAQPGCLDEFFRGRNPEGKNMGELFGELVPINPAYRNRDARIKLLDTQGIEGAFLFPTLGVGMQESLRHDPEAAATAFEGFNRWLAEDWGYAYQDRLFAAPCITLVDPARAEAEIDRLIADGVKLVSMVPGPVPTATSGYSPGDARFDGFWARAAEAGVPVAFHAGDSGYRAFTELWSGDSEFRAFQFNPLQGCFSAEPIHDTFAALICHGAFERHPKLRVASIECGSDWVESLVRKLKKAYGQMRLEFKRDPVEQLREHCFVAPYYEDDINSLRKLIGSERLLFGSDFPHAEGLAEPLDYVEELKDFSPREVRQVMRDNGLGLVTSA